MKTPVRVRFAPSPTGFMHLGSVRVALLNYIFAKKHAGTFVLRIEDTDAARNLDAARAKIVEDLAWLSLPYQEGPLAGGDYGPYLQSERDHIYQEQLNKLIANGKVYRCFCTPEELDAKRQKQIAMGKPPRYDRTCTLLNNEKIEAKLEAATPFIWRFKLNYDQTIEIHDIARGKIHFEMKHFSDFALTRQDGTCTFMFANFVDDWLMAITHVIRGEDHLSNTALQAALFDAFSLPLPIYWHIQIMCNVQGEKLSKRDFGFSLEDLKQAGYLPIAILNYMATVGVSFAEEVQSLEELIQNYNFDTIHHTGGIRYDVEKLNWFNHKWLNRFDASVLLPTIKPLLHTTHTASASLDDATLTHLISKVKGDVYTLPELVKALDFMFVAPTINKDSLVAIVGQQASDIMIPLLQKHYKADDTTAMINAIKADGLAQGLKTKEILGSIRLILTGNAQGIGINDLATMLTHDDIVARIALFLSAN